MKNALKFLSYVSLSGFFGFWLIEKLGVDLEFNTYDFRSIFVLVYLMSSIYLYKIILTEKNNEIKSLKARLDLE